MDKKEKRIVKALEGEKFATINLGKVTRIASDVYDRGYNVSATQIEAVVEALKKFSVEKEDTNAIVDKVCDVLDAMGVEKEPAIEFEGEYYRKNKLAECYSIAITNSSVKDPDKLINWLRALNNDLNRSGKMLKLEDVPGYITEYNALKEEAKNERENGGNTR